MRPLFKRIFAFPRPDLEGRWWHRMAKVLVAISTVIIIFLSIRWGNDIFKPYDVFSFENDFNKYSSTYRVENCSLETLCGEDENAVVFQYLVSGQPGAYDYVHNRDVGGESYYQIFQDLEGIGALANLRAVDLQNNFYGDYFKVLYVIVIPILWYLLLTQGVYRIVTYILVGNKNKKSIKL